jgi:hypothetical protein
MSLCLLDAARTTVDEASASLTDSTLSMLRLLIYNENGRLRRDVDRDDLHGTGRMRKA